MDDTLWQRRCALCGDLDDHPYAAPTGEDDWTCRRCDAVRALWEPVGRPEHVRRPA